MKKLILLFVLAISIQYAKAQALTVSVSSTPATCNGNCDGTATATASGGQAPYLYSWNTSATTQSVTGLCAGIYTVTVTDALLAAYSTTVSITQPTPINVSCTITQQIPCYGSNGAVSVIASGGLSPYTYLWVPGNITTPTIINATAGTYTVVVTDSHGCYQTATITLTQPMPVTATMSSTPATCGNGNGTATAVASGGFMPYTYQWSPNASGQTAATATALLAGAYTVTVTDANGCTGTNSVIVTNTGGPSASIGAISNVTCYAGSDGAATVNASAGSPPYTYTWAPYGGTAATATGLDGFTGTYSVTVTDAIGCFVISTVTITQPAPINISVSSTIPSGCNAADGSMTINATGGTGAYTYSWSPSGPNSPTCTGMIGNMGYTITVVDVHGCYGMLGVTIGDSCNYVWPGDANDDAVADNTDILDIGIANGATGTTRANASLTWIGQPSNPWGQTLLSGTDYKWVDCNGDGTINPADTNAVVLNFGLTHNNRMGAAPVYDAALPDLTVMMNQNMVSAGSPGTLSVALGNASQQASNVYGVAFTLNFDPAQIDANSFRMNNANCWMGTAGNDLMGVVLKPASGAGFVQVAITRLDHNNTSGSGTIADLGFMTTALLDNTGNMQNVNFTLSNVTVISANETVQQVNMVNDSVTVADSSVVLGINGMLPAPFSVYPNPSAGKAVLHLPESFTGKNCAYVLSDAAGRIVYCESFTGSATHDLQLMSLDAGIYFCTITAEGKTAAVTKIVKQ